MYKRENKPNCFSIKPIRNNKKYIPFARYIYIYIYILKFEQTFKKL